MFSKYSQVCSVAGRLRINDIKNLPANYQHNHKRPYKKTESPYISLHSNPLQTLVAEINKKNATRILTAFLRHGVRFNLR
jgi:hypothetical protein